jgi:thiol-disulfide isomerase/thioredoxin
MRLLIAAAVSLCLGLFVTFAHDEKADRAGKLTALKKKYDAEFKDLSQRLEKATDAGTARGIQTELRELVAITADKALAIAKEDPKDETGFAAAEFLVQSASKVGAGGLKEVEAAVDLIVENHAANPKVKDLLIPAMRLGKSGDKLLAAVSEKATDKDTKGLALFIGGYKAARQADEAEDEKTLGEAVAKATDLLQKAAKEAPGLKVGNSNKTIEEMTKKELAGLKGITIVAVGNPAPDVENVTLEGKKVKLSDYKGKVVLLDIWATWCPPCRAMIPHERELVKEMKDKPFVLVSVSADDEKETLTKFLEKEQMPWVHWWNDGAENVVLKKYRVRAFPTLYLIDHSGKVREKWVGNPGNEKIDKAVKDLVDEAAKANG